MNEPKPFASLSPSLLARKGGARPAMRSQLQPMQQFRETTARQIEDDLGWNDMGHDELPQAHQPEQHTADVVALNPGASVPEAEVPDVVRQQEAIIELVAGPAQPVQPVKQAAREARPRRSALADGRRAAFTLRLDDERHLQLRLACTINNRSAQQVVTDALDRLLAELPDVATLAAQVKKRR